MDSNPSKEDSNPNFRKCRLGNLKKEIRIPMEWIRIRISVSLLENQDSNPQGMDLNLESKKGQESLLEEVNSNPHATYSNLDSSKFAQTTWIRISIG